MEKKVVKQYYGSQESFIVMAGKDYYATNRGELPTTVKPESTVKLSTLVSDEYIDPVYNYKKKLCNQDDKSYVQVIYVKPGVYSYAVYLTCPDYTSKDTWYWSNWQKDKPTNVVYETQLRYNYRLASKTYTGWKVDDEIDETLTNADYVERQTKGSSVYHIVINNGSGM